MNGRPVRVSDVETHTTFLSWLRQAGWVGSKEGCAEGECGACAVLLARSEGQGTRLDAVNGCLLLLPSLAGQEVWTVEGLARGEKLHPVQEALLQGVAVRLLHAGVCGQYGRGVLPQRAGCV